MTLIMTVFAAVISTVVWYVKAANGKKLCLGVLTLEFWGASLMWLMDAVAEYLEEGAKSFRPSTYEMLNDAYLGLYVIALGLIIWIIVVLIKDPKGVVRKTFKE